MSTRHPPHICQMYGICLVYMWYLSDRCLVGHLAGIWQSSDREHQINSNCLAETVMYTINSVMSLALPIKCLLLATKIKIAPSIDKGRILISILETYIHLQKTVRMIRSHLGDWPVTHLLTELEAWLLLAKWLPSIYKGSTWQASTHNKHLTGSIGGNCGVVDLYGVHFVNHQLYTADIIRE